MNYFINPGSINTPTCTRERIVLGRNVRIPLEMTSVFLKNTDSETQQQVSGRNKFRTVMFYGNSFNFMASKSIKTENKLIKIKSKIKLFLEVFVQRLKIARPEFFL